MIGNSVFYLLFHVRVDTVISRNGRTKYSVLLFVFGTSPIFGHQYYEPCKSHVCSKPSAPTPSRHLYFDIKGLRTNKTAQRKLDSDLVISSIAHYKLQTKSEVSQVWRTIYRLLNWSQSLITTCGASTTNNKYPIIKYVHGPHYWQITTLSWHVNSNPVDFEHLIVVMEILICNL